MIIKYENFLSTRFDLVIRYYFLEKTDFDAIKAKNLALSGKYKFLRIIFDKLLTIDVKTNSHAAKKSKLYKSSYGEHVARQLFFMKNWLWIEENISSEWTKNNPYPIKMNGVGGSVKRFIISLNNNNTLYWMFSEKGKTLLELWKENSYKELMEPKKWKKIMKSKNHMMGKMLKLNFFSDDTYVGDKKLYEEYIRNIQT